MRGGLVSFPSLCAPGHRGFLHLPPCCMRREQEKPGWSHQGLLLQVPAQHPHCMQGGDEWKEELRGTAFIDRCHRHKYWTQMCPTSCLNQTQDTWGNLKILMRKHQNISVSEKEAVNKGHWGRKKLQEASRKHGFVHKICFLSTIFFLLQSMFSSKFCHVNLQ